MALTSGLNHSPLDILPVPANTVYCKACCTIHVIRAQLCPAQVLDICGIHKTVFVPHQKSLYPGSHLTDADTECPNCIYGSDKKHNRALTRSNSRALRPSLTHKDIVFCVYCWKPATKKCDHLASCREHSFLYLRSQIDINAKWWLRPSDFACHLCPPGAVMQRKAGEWSKDISRPPSPGYFSDEWEVWKGVIVNQIERLHPGAFQSTAAKSEYVAWMNQLSADSMLYLRYLSYDGTYPVTIIYAETGTVPRTIQYPIPPSQGSMEPPPPYPHSALASQTTFGPNPFSSYAQHPYSGGLGGSDTSAGSSSTNFSTSSVTSRSSAASSVPSTPMPPIARPIALIGNGHQPQDYGNRIQSVQPVVTPRRSHIHSMHSQSHGPQLSQVRSPQLQTVHASVSHQPWESQASLSQFYQEQQNQALQRQQQSLQSPHSTPAVMSQLQQGLAQMTISSQNGPTHLAQPFHSAPVVPPQIPVNPPLGFHQKRASNMSVAPPTQVVPLVPLVPQEPPVVPPQPPPTPYEIPETEYQPPSRRVSFANQVQHQTGCSSQYQIPLSPASSMAAPQPPMNMAPSVPLPDRPVAHPFAPYVRGPPQPQATGPSSGRSGLTQFLAQLREARLPPQHGYSPSTTLPGSYPGRPADDDWETLSNVSAESHRPQPPRELSYQGLPQTNPMYAAFQAAHAQGHSQTNNTGHLPRASYNPFARI